MWANKAYIVPTPNNRCDPMLKRSILLLILLFATSKASAQDIDPDMPRPRFGGYGALNLNMHTADFDSIPGIAGCCQPFQSGTGRGITLGGLYEMPLSEMLML